MTPEEKRIKIAELIGWNYYKEEVPRSKPKRYRYVLQSPDDEIKVLPEFTVAHADCENDEIAGFGRLPDFLNDLNAMNEAANYLRNKDRMLYLEYQSRLEKLVAIFNSLPERDACHAVGFCDATSDMRADAFLLTHGIQP